MEVLQKLKNILSSDLPRILIIEDTPSMADRIAQILLDSCPLSVIHVPKSYTEVKQHLKENIYDIILLDNSLTSWSDSGGSSGIKTLPLIKETNPRSFILFTSNQEEVGKILLDQGSVDYARSKHFLEELFEEIKAL